MKWICRILPLAGLAAAASGLGQSPQTSRDDTSPAAASAAISLADSAFFESKIRPLLAENCFSCHGPEKQKAGLRLDSAAGILKGGESGPAVVPGRPESSLLIDAINHGDIVQMPPTGKLPPQEIADLTTWVKMGLPWPQSVPIGQRQADGAPLTTYADEAVNHWAFQRPGKPALPMVSRPDWPQSPADHFILAKLDAAGLEPAPPANKRQLIRRVTFDLTGLPPPPGAIADFLQDESPDAFARLVDRLLASPQYGERWGRHWLDVARYADSNGADENRIHANAWRYRDYVVAAFNADFPYDQFIVEQLAGDLLPAADRQTRNRHWIATGFLAIGPKPLLANDAVKVELDVVDEQLDTTGRALLGLTLGCARCHDHKFDPITARDYYSLAGIFKSTLTIPKYDFQNHRTWNERALGSDEDERRHQELKEAYDQANELRRLNDEPMEQKKHSAQMKVVRKELAAIPVAMTVRDGKVQDLHVLVRGNHLTPGDVAPRGFPRVLKGDRQEPLDDGESGRLALAQWLIRPDHPLTARVIVNRLWKWHFGEGIVRSVDNFGVLGERPDNQPLLDYLAVEFVDSGWSIKTMHRRILLSSAYQMASSTNPQSAIRNPQSVDPENRLLWRTNRRRLDAEEIRDAALSVSGQLDLAMGGAVFSPEHNAERVSERSGSGGVIARAYQTKRRSLYLPVIRSGLFDLFQAFDFGEPSVVTGRRETTTVAPQALLLMNGDLVWQAAKGLAERLRAAECADDESRVCAAYELAFGRAPSRTEIGRVLDFIKSYEDELENDGLSPPERRKGAWEAWCRVLLASNEFIYIN
jgi:hypothetical protein